MGDTTASTDFSDAPFVAVSAHYYGFGFTVDEAKRNLKANGGSLRQYFVYEYPVGAVNTSLHGMFGSPEWEWADEKTANEKQGTFGSYVEQKGIPELKDRIVSVTR